MYLFRNNPSQRLRLNVEPIEWVSEHNYLGVMMDKNLTFINSVEYVVKKTDAIISIRVPSALFGVGVNIIMMV